MHNIAVDFRQLFQGVLGRSRTYVSSFGGRCLIRYTTRTSWFPQKNRAIRSGTLLRGDIAGPDFQVRLAGIGPTTFWTATRRSIH